MAVTKDQKKYAFSLAVDITKAYGTGGSDKVHPDTALKDLYAAIKELLEDIEKN